MVNTIFITSLSQDDKKVFQFDNLYDKINDELLINCMGNYQVLSSSDFIKTLDDLKTLTFNGSLILQINMHGYTNLEGIVFVDGSDLIWKDFDETLRNLNKKLKGKLYLVMAICYGMHFKRVIDYYENLSQNKKSPFRGIFASKTPVYDYEANNMFTFYKSLDYSNNIEDGVNAFIEKVPNSEMEYQDLYKMGLDYINNKSSVNIIPEEYKNMMKISLVNGMKDFFLID